MRFAFIIFICAFSALQTSAQIKDLSLTEINQHIKESLYKNYHPDSIAVSKLCRRACIFIKFRVNEQKKITEIAFSKDSVLFIQDALINAIKALQDDGALIATLQKSGKTVIQPIIYYYQAGCALSKETEISTIGKKNPNDQNKKSYFEIRDDMEYFGATLSDMLNFSDKKLTVVDCILLSPYEVASGSIF